MSTTLAQAQATLDALEAEYDEEISNKHKSSSISTEGVSRAHERRSLKELREEIEHWKKRVRQLQRGGIGVRGITPR